MPDILVAAIIPYADYAASGLFADFYPFIDGDNEFSPGGYTEPATAIRNNRQIMARVAIANYSDVPYYKALFGDDIIFKGFPNTNRNGHEYRQFFNPLSIINTSPNKDAAWSFVRTILDEYWHLDYAYGRFPSNNAAFVRITEEILEGSEDDVFHDGVQTSSLTQTDVNMIVELINATTIAGDVENTLIDIIIEEAENYFGGNQSAEDAARIIQSRVSIYLSEKS